MKKVIKKCPHSIALENSIKELAVCEIKFLDYIGQTVTVYVNGGGAVGNGFTGVLMENNRTYIKLLVKPASPPVCALGDKCNARFENPYFCVSCPYAENQGYNPGAIAEIPLNAIVAFVHNALSRK